MPVVRVAAVQASCVLMDKQATLDKVAELTAKAAALGAQLVVFPEVFVPGTPIWIDTRPIWDGDDDWFRLLAENAVVVPGPETERLASLARDHGLWLVIGVEERERGGGTIYNTLLYFSPDGVLAERHRKLVPTGAERTVWGMGDGSTLKVVDTQFGRIGGLICWENYMPLARFHMYAQGVDLWLAPTLAPGDGWIASMRHIARENRMFVIGVNPVLHVDQIPASFPHRDRLITGQYRADNGDWLEDGNTVIVSPSGEILAGPVRQREETLIADLDLGVVLAARRHLDPVGHYHRPDIFRLYVDSSPRPVVVEGPLPSSEPMPATAEAIRAEQPAVEMTAAAGTPSHDHGEPNKIADRAPGSKFESRWVTGLADGLRARSAVRRADLRPPRGRRHRAEQNVLMRNIQVSPVRLGRYKRPGRTICRSA